MTRSKCSRRNTKGRMKILEIYKMERVPLIKKRRKNLTKSKK